MKRISFLERVRQEAARKAALLQSVANDAHKEYIRLETEYTEATYKFDESTNRYFNRNESPEDMSFDDILDALMNKAYNSYRLRGNYNGMILLGSTEDGAREEIADYKKRKYAEADKYHRSNLDKISFWKKMLSYRFGDVKQDEGGTVGFQEGAGFFCAIAKDRDGFSPFVNTRNFVYTRQFYNFIFGQWDRISITGIRRAISAANQYERNARLSVATKLQYIIGKKKSCIAVGVTDKVELRDLDRVVKIASNPLSSILLEETTTKRPLEQINSFRTDSEGIALSRRDDKKYRDELKKLIYQEYLYDILPFYENTELEEKIDFNFLYGKGLLGDSIALTIGVATEQQLKEEEEAEYEFHLNVGGH